MHMLHALGTLQLAKINKLFGSNAEVEIRECLLLPKFSSQPRADSAGLLALHSFVFDKGLCEFAHFVRFVETNDVLAQIRFTLVGTTAVDVRLEEPQPFGDRGGAAVHLEIQVVQFRDKFAEQLLGEAQGFDLCSCDEEPFQTKRLGIKK